jgi:hypothetical protein
MHVYPSMCIYDHVSLQAQAIDHAMNEMMWDGVDHFVTSVSREGSISDFVDYDSNLMALAFGAADTGTCTCAESSTHLLPAFKTCIFRISTIGHVHTFTVSRTICLCIGVCMDVKISYYANKDAVKSGTEVLLVEAASICLSQDTVHTAAVTHHACHMHMGFKRGKYAQK